MADWVSLTGKIPMLKQVCRWVHKHLLEFLLGRKRLTLVLSRQQASQSGRKLVTTLTVTNNTNRKVVVLYASEGRGELPILLHRETKKMRRWLCLPIKEKLPCCAYYETTPPK